VGLLVPDGFATYGVSVAKSKFSTGMTLASGTHLVTYGDSTTYMLTAERTVFRDQDSRYSAVAALSQVEGATSTVNDAGVSIMDTNRLARTLGAGLKITNIVGGGNLYLRPEISFGLVPTPNTVSDGPQGEFTKATVDMNYERRFDGLGQQWGWSSNFKGQYSRDQLLSSQQILLGSMASVRGFVKNAMSGDSGYYWRNELAWHTQTQLANLSVKNKLFAGFDFGHISNNNPDPLLPRGGMTGYVLGLTSQVEKMSIDLFWTKALSLPSTMKIESPQTWVRVSYSL
jgi:hemolysin activation/secretion protein